MSKHICPVRDITIEKKPYTIEVMVVEKGMPRTTSKIAKPYQRILLEDAEAEKLHTKTSPYPYTSQEVFERSIRMPIGPEFHPMSTIGALNRPEVVKKSGVMIKPIKFEDVKPHERTEQHKKSGQKKKKKSSGRSIKSMTAKGIKVR